MRHQSYVSKAEAMYERAMEEIHEHADDVKEVVEELSVLIDELEGKPSKDEIDRAEELVAKAIISLCKIQ